MKYLSLLLIVLIVELCNGTVEKVCVPKYLGRSSFVCVCNSTYCDDLRPVRDPKKGQVFIISSSKKDKRWRTTKARMRNVVDHFFGKESPDLIIKVDKREKFQRILGFGGAFTDAFGINLRSVTSTLQKFVLKGYFSTEGLEYNLGRVPIAGTDFSTHPYSYDDLPPGQTDPLLKRFSLMKEDFKYKIPFIHGAKSMTESRGMNLLLYASPWSGPEWMKDNHKLNGDGKLKKEFYSAYANYILKFFEEYEKNGIEFFAVTTQNEPTAGLFQDYAFNQMAWMPQDQGVWIGEHFGPLLRKSKFSKVKIYALDDQRIFLPNWILKLNEESNATEYVDGIAVHWYWDFITSPKHLDLTHKYFPHMPILYTEACAGWAPWDLVKVIPGSWMRAESYAKNIIQDLRHWVVGWTDWNMALNMEGGPNWVKNYVDSPVLVNAKEMEIYKQPTYYALAHFSKVIPKDSVRISSASEGAAEDGVHFVAFLRPDGSCALIIVNVNESSVKFRIEEGKKYLENVIGPNTIMSLVWRT